jgi:hypothetical protein
MQPLAIRGVLETVLILGRAATASLSSLRNSIASPPPPRVPSSVVVTIQ